MTKRTGQRFYRAWLRDRRLFRHIRQAQVLKNASVRQPRSIEPLPRPFCHSERSRGICSSADLSWKCFGEGLIFKRELLISQGLRAAGTYSDPAFEQISATGKNTYKPRFNHNFPTILAFEWMCPRPRAGFGVEHGDASGIHEGWGYGPGRDLSRAGVSQAVGARSDHNCPGTGKKAGGDLPARGCRWPQHRGTACRD